jgi:CRP-like cAMP-binding protein
MLPITQRTNSARSTPPVADKDSRRAPPHSALAQQSRAERNGRDIDALKGTGAPIHLTRDKLLFQEGEDAAYFYKVVSGAIRTYKMMADGRRQIADFFLPFDFFGFDSADSYGFSAEAITDTTVIRYPRHSVLAQIESSPELGRRMFAMLCDKLTAAQNQMVLLGRKTAEERIASFLLKMADRIEQGAVDGEVDLPMTRADIADYLGLTVETVSRIFSRLKRNGVVGLPSPQHVVLRRRDTLSELDDGGRERYIS